MPAHSVRGLFSTKAGLLLGVGILLSGCGDVSASIGGTGFKARAKAARIEAEQLRHGQVGGFLHDNADDRIRFIAYKMLEQHRVRLRSGTEQWNPLDLVAIEEQSQRDMMSSYAPLAKAARAQYIWARLESLEPGELAERRILTVAVVVAVEERRGLRNSVKESRGRRGFSLHHFCVFAAKIISSSSS